MDFMHALVYQAWGLTGMSYYAVCYGTAITVIGVCAWAIHALVVDRYAHHPLL